MVSEENVEDGTAVTCWIDLWGFNATLSPIIMSLLKNFCAAAQAVDSAPLI